MVLLIGHMDDVLDGGGIKGENNKKKETAIYVSTCSVHSVTLITLRSWQIVECFACYRSCCHSWANKLRRHSELPDETH